jgi:cytochrome c peroxidase
VTGRRAPSAINAGYSPTLFWDGRAGGALVDPLTGQVVLPRNAALESQVLGPPLGDSEMAHVGRGWDDVVDRIQASEPLALSDFVPADLDTWIANRSYPELFAEVFGTNAVTPVRIAMAVATYERTLLANQTPWDAVLAGAAPVDVMTPQEIDGVIVYLSAGGTFGAEDACDRCHGPNIAISLTDHDFHYIGVRPHAEDLGRFAETGDPADRGAMRTPALRNLELRAPYFHNGGMATIEDVVEFYDRGGDFDAGNNEIEPLGLTATEKAALVAFLKHPLTDPRVAAGLPPFDRPSQYADSAHVPATFGQGTYGTGNIVPHMMAIEPPKTGNPNLTLAIGDALGSAVAVLVLDPVPDFPGTVLFGATFHVGLSPALQRPLVQLGGVGAGEGFGSYTLAVPDDPTIIGQSIYAQWFVFDTGSPVRFSATEAVELTWY